MGNCPLALKGSDEPSNINFENKYDSEVKRSMRKLVTYTILGMLVVLGFIAIFLTQKETAKLYREYPAVDCDDLTSEYGE